MQIQLKQVEIVAALKQYISQKGIDLTGKEVIINFTAGRKEAGITADLAIDDFDIPGFSEPEPTSLTLVSVQPIQVIAAAAPLPADDDVGYVPTAPAEKTAKSVSLFN